MVDSKKIHLPVIVFSTWNFLFKSVLLWVYMEFFKKSYWLPWIWHLFTSHCVFGVFFYKCVGNDLRIYLTLMVTNCNAERSYSKLKMVERTKEHLYTKQTEQHDSKDCRARTPVWIDTTSIINKFLWQNLENAILSSRIAAFDNWLRPAYCDYTV